MTGVTWISITWYLVAIGQLAVGVRLPGVGETFYTTHDTLYIIERMGSGAYGTVFRCYSDRMEEEVALKIEHYLWTPNQSKYMTIEHEYKMLRQLQDKGFPTVYESNFEGTLKYIVMEIAGEAPLWTLMQRQHGRKLPRIQVANIGRQLFRILQRVHDAGIILYDLHVGNVLYSRTDNGSLRIRLIDPGMAFFYRWNGQHRKPVSSPIPDMNKRPDWTCADDDAGIFVSRRCEIQRALYLIYLLLEAEFPWSYLTDPSTMIAYKQSFTPQELCSTPSTAFLIPAFEHALSLAYEARPDYEGIIKLFDKQLRADLAEVGRTRVDHR